MADILEGQSRGRGRAEKAARRGERARATAGNGRTKKGRKDNETGELLAEQRGEDDGSAAVSA
eukprot:4391934-Heterocapsa_arctica.AAC.1